MSHTPQAEAHRPNVIARWLLLALVALWLTACRAGGLPDAEGEPPLPVLWLGAEGAARQALFVTDRVQAVNDLAAARLVVAEDNAIAPAQLPLLQQALAQRIALLLLLGPQSDEQALRALLGHDLSLTPQAAPQSLAAPADPLLRRINWLSAPQVRARHGLGNDAALTPLVQTVRGEAVVATDTGRGAPVWLVTAWLDAPSNRSLREWAYFNYALYALAYRAAGADFLTYADFPAAPVPHAAERAAIVGLVVLLLATTFAAFAAVRRYSLQHPEALAQLVSNTRLFQARETTLWRDIGFHRPLAGFLLLLSAGLVLFILLAVWQQVILFGRLLPSAQVRGIWSLIQAFFTTVWILFDWGTSTAFVKFFAEYRIDDPERGLKYGQFYVWWQALTGTVQLSLVVLAATFIVPQTANAFMSYFIIVHALSQFPGCLRMFQYFFRAFQRQDYDQAINIVLFLLPVLLQSGAVLVMSRWGAGQPAFGPSLGGLLGLGIGLYLAEWSAFGVGYLLLRRLGCNAAPLFMAHFDRETARTALRFGLPITIAGVAGSLGFTVQATLTAQMLTNWTEIQGNWDVVGPGGLLLAFAALGGLFYGLMPALAQAFHHKLFALIRYYIAQGFKYGGFISAFIASALLGIGDRFILGALGPDFTRAAALVSIMAVWGIFQFPAWFSDRLQEGAGRPDLLMWMLIMEQATRIALMLLLIPSLGLTGLLLAYGVALPLKDVVAWAVNRRQILTFRIPWWQAAASPLLAAAVNLVVLRLVGHWFWTPDLLPSVLLFCWALLAMLPFYCFCNGLFGGWDDHGLWELRRAARMSGLGAVLAVLIVQPSLLGARRSPLHNRFAIPQQQAMAEARSLSENSTVVV